MSSIFFLSLHPSPIASRNNHLIIRNAVSQNFCALCASLHLPPRHRISPAVFCGCQDCCMEAGGGTQDGCVFDFVAEGQQL